MWYSDLEACAVFAGWLRCPGSNDDDVLEHDPAYWDWEGWIGHGEIADNHALLPRVEGLDNICSRVVRDGHLIHIAAIEETVVGEGQCLVRHIEFEVVRPDTPLSFSASSCNPT